MLGIHAFDAIKDIDSWEFINLQPKTERERT
jgi:hypothetical protein